LVGALLIGAGALTLVWAFVVWRWQDPFTALYTHWKQHELAQQLDKELGAYRAPHLGGDLAAERRMIDAEAARFRARTKTGEPIGRIVIGRIGLKMVLVDGTDESSLKKGPGRDLVSYMPGQNRLVYIAGHRTTYLAPFSHINDIRPGDSIRLEMPYATFLYRAFTHRIVTATDLSVLRSPRHELLELQACHPRFFATHRYIVYAKLVRVIPRGGPPYSALQAQPANSGPGA
jgi:sortase A